MTYYILQYLLISSVTVAAMCFAASATLPLLTGRERAAGVGLGAMCVLLASVIHNSMEYVA